MLIWHKRTAAVCGSPFVILPTESHILSVLFGSCRFLSFLTTFVDKNDYYTLSFFDEAYKKDLMYLGTHSGRDEDKLAKTSLTPVFSDESVYFKEAKMVFVCRKVYKGVLHEEGFIDQDILKKNYPEHDFHYVYIGEIVKAYVNED